jgi:hypothetical protein
MRKAGLASEKPGDVFKVKTKHKGDARYEGPLEIFRQLIKVHADGRYKFMSINQ